MMNMASIMLRRIQNISHPDMLPALLYARLLCVAGSPIIRLCHALLPSRLPKLCWVFFSGIYGHTMKLFVVSFGARPLAVF
tara:strand:+ start:344 stop:586 length:243 start_codon:yes stop_codon:yes gene_type:complete